MSDNIDNRRQTRRISSILKTVVANGDSPTQTFNRRSKRISFSHVNNVKEFVADGNNQTIWGESYEKGHTVPDASSSGSVGSAQTLALTTDSVAQSTQLISFLAPTAPPAPTIGLFADIENVSDANVDVEMDISYNHDSQSPTKLFNQTMFIEETVTSSVTNCHMVDMSIAGNKRRTIETISTDIVTTDVKKSVKIRKMNDENIEPNRHNTILHHVNMSVSNTDNISIEKPEVNFNTTRIFDGDADLSDVDHLPSKLPPKSLAPSYKLHNSPASTVDITIDNLSIASPPSDTSKSIDNKTFIFGRGDTTARIDQTFAVRNPLQENNVKEWNSLDKSNDSGKHISKDSSDVVENNVPSAFTRHHSGNSRQRTLEDLNISMDIQFKSHSLSPHSLHADEPAIEDLTIFLDTNFKAEVSGENDSALESMDKFTNSLSDSATNTNSLAEKEQKSPIHQFHAEPSMASFPDHHIESAASEENLFGILPSTSHTVTTERNAQNITSKMYKDMTLDSVVNGIGSATREKVVSPVPDLRFDSASEKLPKVPFCWDSAALHDHVSHDFTFAHSEPLSSTRFISSKKCPQLSDGDINTKANSSNVTFNYCPTLTTTRQSRSAASLQNNTDELCNLEPDQLKKRSEMKKLFLSLSEDACDDMLSETKMDLVDVSIVPSIIDDETKDFTVPAQSTSELSVPKFPDSASDHKEITSSNGVAVEVISTTSQSNAVPVESRCRKCLNCSKSLDGKSTTYLRKDELISQPKLDFSMYNQFKGLATMKDVIEAHKRRQVARELEEQLLVDQNVEAPDIRLLWMNKNEEVCAGEPPRPVYIPEPLTCFPLRMNIKYLMRNKMRTEYTQWKYNDNFFNIGAVALRYDNIPSIRIHLKFDPNGPTKADELNMPLLFKRVFIEECSTYLRRISPVNFVKHKHALASLPTNLTTILSDSSNIYRGLDEIENYFRAIVTKVDELDALTVEHDAKLVLDDGQCFIEQTIFDSQTYWIQEFGIKLDKVDTVGAKDVFFRPACTTTNEFKALPSGLAFLRLFLADPKSYLVPCLDR